MFEFYQIVIGNMATGRSTRSRKGLNYAKLNAVGTTELDELEEGQIEDSPFRLNASDDDFQAESLLSGPIASIPSHRIEDPGEELDYDDVLQGGRSDHDTISLSSGPSAAGAKTKTKTVKKPKKKQPTETNYESEEEMNNTLIPQLGGDGEEDDLGEQEMIMKENEEKIKKIKNRLERQKRVAEQYLKQEQQKMELARMEQEIKSIHQQRSVCEHDKLVARNSLGDTPLRVIETEFTQVRLYWLTFAVISPTHPLPGLCIDIWVGW